MNNNLKALAPISINEMNKFIHDFNNGRLFAKIQELRGKWNCLEYQYNTDFNYRIEIYKYSTLDEPYFRLVAGYGKKRVSVVLGTRSAVRRLINGHEHLLNETCRNFLNC